MATKRLPSLLVADDSSRTWRFEMDQDLRMALGKPGESKTVAFHRNARLIRPTTGDTAELGFYTGGELGTTFEYSLKLETSGALQLYAYGGGAFPVALSITSGGVATINGCKILTGTVTWDPANITAGNNATTTLTVTGATTSNSIVHAGIPNGFVQDGLSLQAYVSAADTVTLRLYNFSGAGIDPANLVYRVAVFQF